MHGHGKGTSLEREAGLREASGAFIKQEHAGYTLWKLPLQVVSTSRDALENLQPGSLADCLHSVEACPTQSKGTDASRGTDSEQQPHCCQCPKELLCRPSGHFTLHRHCMSLSHYDTVCFAERNVVLQLALYVEYGTFEFRS